MREIEFRGKRADNKWQHGSLVIGTDNKTTYIFTNDGAAWGIDPATVGQFTGLHDNTKWEQLTEQERLDFYNKCCSEDGKTIKYQHVDDVKHLWIGRKIYEGDIIVCRQSIDGNTIDCLVERGFVEFKFGAFGLHRKQGYYRPFKDWLEDYAYEVIGNKWDNPELLGR